MACRQPNITQTLLDSVLTALVVLDRRVGTRVNKLLARLLRDDLVLLAEHVQHGRVEREVVCEVRHLRAGLEAADGDGDYGC